MHLHVRIREGCSESIRAYAHHSCCAAAFVCASIYGIYIYIYAVIFVLCINEYTTYTHTIRIYAYILHTRTRTAQAYKSIHMCTHTWNACVRTCVHVHVVWNAHEVYVIVIHMLLSANKTTILLLAMRRAFHLVTYRHAQTWAAPSDTWHEQTLHALSSTWTNIFRNKPFARTAANKLVSMIPHFLVKLYLYVHEYALHVLK